MEYCRAMMMNALHRHPTLYTKLKLRERNHKRVFTIGFQWGKVKTKHNQISC